MTDDRKDQLVKALKNKVRALATLDTRNTPERVQQHVREVHSLRKAKY